MIIVSSIKESMRIYKIPLLIIVFIVIPSIQAGDENSMKMKMIGTDDHQQKGMIVSSDENPSLIISMFYTGTNALNQLVEQTRNIRSIECVSIILFLYYCLISCFLHFIDDDHSRMIQTIRVMWTFSFVKHVATIIDIHFGRSVFHSFDSIIAEFVCYLSLSLSSHQTCSIQHRVIFSFFSCRFLKIMDAMVSIDAHLCWSWNSTNNHLCMIRRYDVSYSFHFVFHFCMIFLE